MIDCHDIGGDKHQSIFRNVKSSLKMSVLPVKTVLKDFSDDDFTSEI
jgi:hypothetical protein